MHTHTWIASLALLTGLLLLGGAEGNSASSCTDGRDNDGDAASSPGMDCDDRDDQVFPGQGC